MFKGTTALNQTKQEAQLIKNEIQSKKKLSYCRERALQQLAIVVFCICLYN